MDWPEILRKIVALAGPSATITFNQLDSLLPARIEPEDIEYLLVLVSQAGIYIEND